MNRRYVILGAALAVAALAFAAPKLVHRLRSPHVRPLSVEGITIKSRPIGVAETTNDEASWSPAIDVYVVGWSHFIGSTPGVLTLLAPGPTETVLMRARGGADEIRPVFVTGGTGYRLNKGERLRATLQVTNTGPASETHGAQVLVYFIPAEGN